MQYGAEVITYKRLKENKKGQKSEGYISSFRIVGYFVAAIFISRVVLINSTAPFGLAFIMAVMNERKDKLSIAAGTGAIIGYVTLYKNLDDIALYIIMIGTLILFGYFTGDIARRKRIFFISLIMLLESIIFRAIINQYTLGINILTSSFHIGCILPIYFIIDYALTCSREFKSKHLFTNEEIISMSIVFSLIISGTWGIKFFNIDIRNVIGLIFVSIMAYVNGSSTGAATGVAIGVIMGITSNNMVNYVSIYAVCGLVTGIFKETGKWFTSLAYITIFTLLKVYLGMSTDFKLIEGLLSFLIFITIPERIYEKISVELDWEKKQDITNESYMHKLKEVFTEKLDSFSEVLINMSTTLNNLVDNDKLLMKTKSSALVENLADRVCSGCDMKSICWKREMHCTYIAFSELIQNYQEEVHNIPYEIERKCVKRTALIKNAEELLNSYIINEMWRNRLSEGRKMLASQIHNMAKSIGKIVEDFSSEVSVNNDMERHIRRCLNKVNIKINDILCYDDRNARLKVKITMASCGGRQKCVKDMLPLINEAVGRPMCICDEGCIINPENDNCTVTFEETPKYHIATSITRKCKDGEVFNGDSYSFGKLKDGTYMTIISDGMGSGPQAGEESKAAVDLIEKFTNAGFDKITAIDTVNSIMSFKFSEDEKFSTVDLNSIDLYSGEVTFMKVGAVASFIKRGEKIDIIKSKTLPIGVLDKVDIDIIEKKVKNGDIVITVSDGVLDCCEGGNMEWLAEYLISSKSSTPKELADEIMEKAQSLTGGKVKDDMTVIVSKIYNLY
ncbi:stage II sporulation protein E [Clostridium amazonitimonense]|uniref:stage II sporulation protein E n=1 Tax=Clostridium amazonitimonense TaxID=1499689 RepID=UPI0005099D98|nr:stage II sporulation protein E [Clostridium amazonitimonense]